jgi:hypothetical protein
MNQMNLWDLIPWIGRDRWTITPMWMSENRTAAEGSLLRILAFAERERLDAHRMVDLFASEHWGIYRWRFGHVAKQLQVAKTIEQGLVASGLPHDDHTIVCLRIGRATSNPELAWEENLYWNRPINAHSALLWRNQMFYWTMVGLVLMNILTAFWFVCGRSLQRMLVEFGLQDYGENLELLPPISLQITFGLLVALQVYWLFQLIWKTSFGPLKGRVGKQFVWGFGSKRRECLRQMALCLRGQIEKGAVLETLLKYNPNERLRRQLGVSLSHFQSGDSVWQSLHAARLLNRRQANALDHCNERDVQSWVLQQFTLDERESSFFRRLACGLWVQPVLTLGFGIAVLFTGFALLDALSQMILAIAERHG